jgi:hypothetical protein
MFQEESILTFWCEFCGSTPPLGSISPPYWINIQHPPGIKTPLGSPLDSLWTTNTRTPGTQAIGLQEATAYTKLSQPLNTLPGSPLTRNGHKTTESMWHKTMITHSTKSIERYGTKSIERYGNLSLEDMTSSPLKDMALGLFKTWLQDHHQQPPFTVSTPLQSVLSQETPARNYLIGTIKF